MWKIIKNNDDQTYNIFNFKYGEPLYADSSLSIFKRNVYTHRISPNYYNHEWMIKCQDKKNIEL